MKRTIVAAGLMLAMGGACLAQDHPEHPAQKIKPAKEQPAEKAVKKLELGDKAPELAIQTWVKGEPITGFETGRVYVVEFWATWCGPCIAGMPHLSELQKEYKDKGVRIIGVNIWDDPEKVKPFMDNPVPRTETTGDQRMGYTVAIEEKIPETDAKKTGRMAEAWMRAAGRNGIPSAFVVDQRGRVAWMGHPSQLDKPLKEIVAGTWDIQKAAEAARREAQLATDVREFQTLLLQEKEYEKAYVVGRRVVEGHWDNAQMLNSIAWTILDTEGIEVRDLDLAMKAAVRADELTDHKDAAIVDTLARAHFEQGDVAKAIQLQEKAVSLADEQMKADLEATLERYKAARKGG